MAAGVAADGCVTGAPGAVVAVVAEDGALAAGEGLGLVEVAPDVGVTPEAELLLIARAAPMAWVTADRDVDRVLAAEAGCAPRVIVIATEAVPAARVANRCRVFTVGSSFR